MTEPIFLETDRLILRKFEEPDFSDFCEFAADPERSRMMGSDPVATVEEARALFDWFLHREKRAYALVLKETGKVVGNLTVYDKPPVKIEGKTGCSLSFSVGQKYRRQGLIQEAMQAVIHRLFTTEDADCICDGFFDFNIASRALHQKLGFEPYTRLDGETFVILWRK